MNDEEKLIAQMAVNRQSMVRIERVFFICSLASIILNISATVIGFILVPAALGFSRYFFVMDTIAAVTSVVSSILSSCKHKNWTIWALCLFLIRTFTAILCFGVGTGAPMLVLGVVPQFICLRQYKELDFLKTQFGYPGFNADIYMHKARRMMSDEEIKARMKRQTETVDSSHFGGVISPDTGEEYEDPVTYRIKPPLD